LKKLFSKAFVIHSCAVDIMLRTIKRNIENRDCRGFNCKVKKVRYPILSTQNVGDSRKDPVASRSDDVSPFESSGTPSSSLTPLSSNGSFNFFSDYTRARKPHYQGDLEIYNHSSSTSPNLTPLSGVFRGSSTNSNEKGFDYPRNSDLCSYSSSPEYSNLSLLSGVQGSLCDTDLKGTRAMYQSEQRNSGDFGRPKLLGRKVGSLSDRGSLKVKKASIGLEVVGNGTRLMRSIQFPTVVVQMWHKKLRKSVVYYVILKSAAGRYVGDIAGLLFATKRSKDAQRAELLPLHTLRSRRQPGTFKLNPMLLRDRYRCLFEEGCTFEIRAIERGRRSDLKKRLWKNYDLEKWEIHDLLSSLLSLDIRQTPAHMLKMMSPLRDTENLFPKRKRRKRKSYKRMLSKERSRGIKIQNVSQFGYILNYFNCNTVARSPLVNWYKASPQMQMGRSEDFFYNFKPNKAEDGYHYDREYIHYLNLSEIV